MAAVRVLLAMLLAMLLVGGAAHAIPALADERPTVAAVNLPLADFARRIGGDAIEVVLPVPPGLDPADWRPTDAAIAILQDADLILRNGAGYARWFANIAVPRYRLVDTSRPVRDRYIPLEGQTTHAHGPEGRHSHGGFASTTWLDFALAAEQAKVVAEALAALVPDRAEDFKARRDALLADLGRLDAEARRLGGQARGRRVIASHPVYQYFARAYGVDIASMHWEPGETPDAGAWADFDAARGSAEKVVMLWEAEPTDATARELAGRDVAIVVFDPAGGVREADFLTVMRSNLENLAAALEQR